jgi:hypothetical protein
MKIRIYFTWPDGNEDSIVLSGTIEEIRENAAIEISSRNATNPWSEVIEE